MELIDGDLNVRSSSNEMEWYFRFPVEPLVGSVLGWEKTFDVSGKVYTYIALHTPNGWYVTGQALADTIISWDAVCGLIGNAPCYIVSAWASIPQLPETEVAVAQGWAGTAWRSIEQGSAE